MAVEWGDCCPSKPWKSWEKSWKHAVDGRNPANQLRSVVYPTIYKVLYIPGGYDRRIPQPSTVSFRMILRIEFLQTSRSHDVSHGLLYPNGWKNAFQASKGMPWRMTSDDVGWGLGRVALFKSYTPQKSNILGRYQTWPCFKVVHLFQTISLGIHVSFRGCTPWKFDNV